MKKNGDLFDVTMGSYDGANDKPLNINTKPNHSPAITKELPKMISRRLTDLSCNEEEFRKSKDPYVSALRNSGYDPKLKFLPGRA